MSNPIFDIMSNSAPMHGNAMNMLQAFNDFKRTFSGDPKAQVQQLLSSGRMTQQQFQQLSGMANQFQNLFK